MKQGQVYITSKNREMEVLFVNGSGERARCRFADGTEADVIVEKCKDYKLVEPKEESEQLKKDFIKKYKLTKYQILFIQKWNEDDLSSLKNCGNTMCALYHKGVAVQIRTGKNSARMELIKEAKIFK